MINPFLALFKGISDLFSPIFLGRSSYQSGRSPKVLNRHIDRVNAHFDAANDLLKQANNQYRVTARRSRRR